MKKHADLIYTLLGVAVVALLVFVVYEKNHPDPLVLDLSSDTELSSEHQLIKQALINVEDFAAEEDRLIVQNILSEPQPAAPLPVAGAPLPVAWDSQPAPNIDEISLSPALQRSIAGSASLRTEEYTNPSSELNLQRVANLRAIREKRQQAN